MRLASLAPSATEIVFALGCGRQLVARTAFCDYPEEARTIPPVGGWTTANVDAVVALQPDLVLTSTFLQARIAEALRANGIAVCHTDPRTLPDVLDSFDSVAAALGVPERGRALRSRCESERAVLASTSGSRGLRVYAEEWPRPPMASGNWVPDLIAAAGGQSLLPPGERSREVSLGEVQQFDPDVIVLNYCGMEQVPVAAQMTHFMSRAGWGALRAVRTQRAAVISDSLLNRPGPRLVKGARELHRVLTALPRAALLTESAARRSDV